MDSLAAGEPFRLRLKRDVAIDTAVGNAQVLALRTEGDLSMADASAVYTAFVDTMQATDGETISIVKADLHAAIAAAIASEPLPEPAASHLTQVQQDRIAALVAA